MTMHISHEYPPIWEEANKHFKIVEKGLKPVFTYGRTLYNPYHLDIPPELLRHEETHMEQQEGTAAGAERWWHQHLRDMEFRIENEAEAYGAQHKMYCQGHKDRNLQARYLHECAKQLSSELYGNVITHAEAMKKIKEYAQNV